MKNRQKKYANGMFDKMLNFFRKIFNKKLLELQSANDKEQEKNIAEDAVGSLNANSINEMKTISKKKKLRDNILEIVEKNPEIIDSLQSSKLELLYEMLDEEIEKNSKELEKLKEKYEKLEQKYEKLKSQLLQK